VEAPGGRGLKAVSAAWPALAQGCSRRLTCRSPRVQPTTFGFASCLGSAALQPPRFREGFSRLKKEPHPPQRVEGLDLRIGETVVRDPRSQRLKLQPSGGRQGLPRLGSRRLGLEAGAGL